MRKLIFATLTLTALAWACKEQDISEPIPDTRNVELRATFSYGDTTFFLDSAITNQLGLTFFIEELELVGSDFFFVDAASGDTLNEVGEPFALSPENPSTRIATFPPRQLGYSGSYGFRVGLDSLASDTLSPSNVREDSELTDNRFYRQKNGIDHLVITGRLIDPNNPFDSTGTIPVEYRFGTFYTSRIKRSAQKNFSVQENSLTPFIVVVNIKPIFDQFDLFQFREITTDLSNPLDTSIAQERMDSLRVNLF